MGNTPRVDLLCAVPDGKQFKVQVKGISNAAGFYIQRRFFDPPTHNDLYLVVVVLVPRPARAPQPEAEARDDERPLRFFILTHKEAQEEFASMPQKKMGPGEPGPGLNWGSITPYENKWASFPERSRAEP